MNMPPQKGRPPVVVRKEQAEVEGKLNELNQRVERIRFQLRKFREE
jgi:hypothetical protein